jgi:hypothetical protein
LPHGQHGAQKRVALVDEIVSEEHRERFVSNVIAGAPNGVAKPAWIALADRVDVRQLRGDSDGLQARRVAFGREESLKLGRLVEMVRDGVLAVPGDDQDIVEPGSGRLGDHVLNGWNVHDG